MEQEATEELDRVERHEPGAGAMRVVFPLETDVAIFEGAQAVIGDRDAVRVASQILEHAAWSAEGWFDVNHPVGGGGLIAESLKGGGVRESFQFAVKLQSAVSEGAAEGSQEGFPEAVTDQSDGEKEAGLLQPIQREASSEIPPSGTTQCRGGCRCRF